MLTSKMRTVRSAVLRAILTRGRVSCWDIVHTITSVPHILLQTLSMLNGVNQGGALSPMLLPPLVRDVERLQSLVVNFV